jgi:sugar phosphate permease
MQATAYRVYRYRWAVLFAFLFITALNQLLWITFAPITDSAASYYGVSDLAIAALSMSFLIVYLFVSLPASWVIDRHGFRTAVGIGALLTGVFGLLRGILAANYALVLICQIGIAIGQPFILNAVTKVAARWFPLEERATAAGLGTLGIYIGILGGMVLTPFLVGRSSIPSTLLLYGIVAMIAAVTFLIVAREHPPTPPAAEAGEERALAMDGLKQALQRRDFVLLLIIFFIGLGLFNSVTTWIEEIVSPRGFSATQAGICGGLMIAGGILGALVVPALSDHVHKRVPFITAAMAGATVGLLGLTFAARFASAGVCGDTGFLAAQRGAGRVPVRR